MRISNNVNESLVCNSTKMSQRSLLVCFISLQVITRNLMMSLSIQSKHDVLHVYLTSYTRLETKAQKIVEVRVRVMLIKEYTITCISVINYSYNFNFFSSRPIKSNSVFFYFKEITCAIYISIPLSISTIINENVGRDTVFSA